MKPDILFNRFCGVFTNDPALFGAAMSDETLAGRIRAEQIYTFQSYAPYVLMANLINALVLILSFSKSNLQTAAFIWAGVLATFVAYAYLQWRITRSNTRRTYETKTAARKPIIESWIHGCIWAAFPLLFMGSDAPGTQLIVIAITIGMLSAGAASLATVPSAVVAFTMPITIASLVSYNVHNLPFAALLSLLVSLFSFVIVRAAFAQAYLFASRIVSEDEQRKKNDMISMLLGEFEENANDWLWETDSIGRIVYISSKFSELASIPLESLKGKSLLRVLTRGSEGAPQPVQAWCDITENLHQRSPFRDLELKIHIAGQPRWCKMTGKPIFSESGRFSGFRGFCTDITKKREDEAKIAYLASFDAVTKLPNRVSFGDRIDKAFRRSNRNKEVFALHCIDLDGFKEINDTFGHAIGDAFLHEIANRISRCLGENDFVARLGGDEFSIIQANVSSREDAEELSQRIIKSVSMPFTVAGSTMKAGASVGIAFAPQDGEDRETLMVNGDLALYRAKADGRGTYRFYETSMDEYARHRRAIETALRTAVEKRELKLLFQPIMDVNSGRISNCESLLRWTHPELGEVSPAEFIPIAEECGLIISIGEWVINEACQQAKRWPDDIKFAVNLSPVQFQSPGLLPVIMHALEESGIQADRLEIEITESVLLSNIERVVAIIGTLDRLGVRIALDDFGTGYSSLAYIRQIDFDKIKIDASFVRDMISDKNCAAIIRAVTGLARDLGIRITAEGVETKEQLEALQAEGCAEMQGYLISQPLSPQDFADFVAEDKQEACKVA